MEHDRAQTRQLGHFCFSFISDFRSVGRSLLCYGNKSHNFRNKSIKYERYGTRCLERFNCTVMCTEIRCRRRLLSADQWLLALGAFHSFDDDRLCTKNIGLRSQVKCQRIGCMRGYWQFAQRAAHTRIYAFMMWTCATQIIKMINNK